ncbi:MAG: YggT family protein [Aeromicrobium sp.]|nr:YggT family protein [Aeromicrobium sp.]
MTFTLARVVSTLIDYYQLLIIAYVLMSWFRPSGVFYDIYRILGSICEPWLGIFRRIVPPLGMMDISPIVAILALRLLGNGLVTLLARLG